MASDTEILTKIVREADYIEWSSESQTLTRLVIDSAYFSVLTEDDLNRIEELANG